MRLAIRLHTRLLAPSLLLSLAAAGARAQTASTPAAVAATAPKPVLIASRLTHAVRVDGRLDEPDWATADVATDFIQRYPDPGHAATLRTEVRVLYDADAVYVGARMFDPHPDSIAAPLARRDPDGISSDWFDVIFDSYHDRRTGFRFGVNPAGTKLDVYHFNDSDDDGSWDALWDVATRIDSLGWTAEYRIPLSQLRFHRCDGNASDAAVRARREEYGGGGRAAAASNQMAPGAAGAAGGAGCTWGLNFYRAVARRDEWSHWAPYLPTTPGFVSAFGELRGLAGLAPSSPIEVVPYVSSHVSAGGDAPGDPFARSGRLGGAVGADLRVGLGPALTLAATINPDFGQVEVDPAVLNLSATETFFPEKRPFFLEGAGIFEFGALPVYASYGFRRFVHWRRIGRAPQLAPPAADWSDAPDQTTILGAAKLSGQLPGGWSLGVLDATTARENARVADRSGARGVVGVEPLTNYFVARAKRDLQTGRTTVGLLSTATNRATDGAFGDALRSDAYLLGADASHASRDRRWTWAGHAIGSRVSGSAAAIAATQRSSVRYYGRPDAPWLPFDPSRTALGGHDAAVGFAYQGTPLFASLQLRETSPGFEANDLGYLSRADARSVAAAVGATHDASSGLVRDARVTAYTLNAWNFGGAGFAHELGATSSIQLHSFWNVTARASWQPALLDDRLTRGGPTVRVPPRWGASGGVTTDGRRRVVAGATASAARLPLGGAERAASVSVTLRPSPSLQLSLAPTLDALRDPAQYVRTVPDATVADGRRYVFAALRQRTLSLDARVDWTLTTALSFQLFAQPFASSARFGEYGELAARARSLALARYGRDAGTVTALDGGRVRIDPDGDAGAAAPFVLGDAPNETSFLSRALRANAVLRWEYRGGSTLYVVWQQTRDGVARLADDASAIRGFDHLLAVPARNVVFVKASYRLGR